MGSRVLSAGVAADSLHPGHDHHHQPPASAPISSSSQQVDSSSSGNEDLHAASVSHRPVASTSKLAPSPSTMVKSPESAPAASNGFLRQRSDADLTDTDDEEDDDVDNRHSRQLPHSLDAGLGDHRFSSPALARRRYPSTSTSARRLSSRSRRTSISATSHSMFDVKGKGVALDDDDDEDYPPEHQTRENGFASVPHDVDYRIAQAPKTAPLLSNQTGRRSVSHSHPSRRYTTAFDPFTTISPSPGNGAADYPDTTKVKKKRSYTIAGASGSGRSREASGSSSPDFTRAGFTPSNPNSFSRKPNHLPRSASDFMTSSSSPNSYSIIAPRPPITRKPNSGSTSPLHPRSLSSGNILNSEAQNQSLGSANRTGAFQAESSLSPNNLNHQVLRHRLSGLQMKSKSRTSPNRASIALPQRENSTSSIQPSSRKRAKSSFYPLDGAHRPSEQVSSSLPARSVSSQHFKRYSALGGQSLEGDLAEFPREFEEPVTARRVHMDDARDIRSSALATTTPTSNGLVGKSILKSGSQPISIASMVSEQTQNGAPPSALPNTGPSLQELLSQVDLTSALTLVREAGRDKTDDLGFQTTGMRASIDAPSTYRSASPIKSGGQSVLSSRTSAASPATNGSSTARAPLLSGHASQAQKKEQDENAGGQLQPSASIFIVPNSNNTFSGVLDKKRKRLSMKRLLGHHGSSNHSRTSSHDTTHQTDDRSSTVGGGSFIYDTTTESHHEPIDMLEEMRQRVDPTMRKYIASVKAELEIRYLPIYTALAMGQDPPNPLAVARYLSIEEETRKSQSLHSLSPTSPSRRYIDEARASGRGGNSSGQPTSLADRIRKKGHKRSVWEVYPRDIATYSMNSKSMDRIDPYDHRSGVLESLSRGKHTGHRHGSSELSLGSLASIREDKALDAFRSDSRHRNNLNQSMRSNGGRYMHPLSPARSRSGQSDISSHIASDDAVAAGHTSVLDKSASEHGPGWSSEGHIQSSPEYSRFNTSLPPHGGKHQSNLSWSSRGFRILRPETNGLSALGHLSRSSYDNFMASSSSRDRVLYGGAESEGALSEDHTSSTRPAFHRSTTSDVDLRSKSSGTMGMSHRPTISRSTSKTSSLAGFSKMLSGRKSTRAFGKEDGYRSTTDNEDLSRYAMSRTQAGRLEGTVPSQSESTSRRSLTGGDVEVGQAGQEREEAIFGKTSINVQEIDVDNQEMERAER